MPRPQLCLPVVVLGLVVGCDSTRRLDNRSADAAAGGSPWAMGVDAQGDEVSSAPDAPDLGPSVAGAGGAAAPIGTGGANASVGGQSGDGVGGVGGVGAGAGAGGGPVMSATGGMAGAGPGGAGPTAGASGSAGSTGLATQCSVKAASSCFEPCGGDLSGNWVLENSCFGPASTSKGVCETVISGTSTKSSLLLTASVAGELAVYGTESWSISATMSLGCRGLAAADLCSSASLLSDALLFSYTQPMSCSPNSCGACDCEAHDVNGTIAFPLSRAVDPLLASFLRTGPFTFPYCVTGDVLWIGGTAQDGTPKVSYKFRKHSCQGTTTPCAQRALAECELGQGCSRGVCTNARPGTATGCGDVTSSDGCLPEQGCLWNPNVCVGTADVSCDPTVCGIRPGCTWGAPMQRCTGISDCAYRTSDQCVGAGLAAGCSLHVCQPPFGTTNDQADCRLIPTAADCAKAPGCVAHPRSTLAPCTGQTSCSAQTSTGTCDLLACASQACTGTSTPCSQVPVASCASVPGCQVSW
jgi:hypothetical protein